jgi:hypothetical protein
VYEIIVNKIEKATRTVQGDWCVVEQRPYTDAEVEKANREWRGNREKVTETRDIYGYAPPKTIQEELKRQVYRQEVDEVELGALIKAVNDK